MTIKLFFFDLEGTLVQSRSPNGEYTANLWTAIPQHLGPDAVAAEEAMYEKWDSGAYNNYLDWCKECIDMYKAQGLGKELFDELLTQAQLNPGVKETITALRERGITTAIISGGFMEQARRVQQELKIDHSCAATEIFWDNAGTIEHYNVYPSDLRGKVDYVELLRREYGLSHEECAFIGDGSNDVEIAKHVGLSFAYKGHEKLKAVATHSITDFRDVLKHL